MAIKAIWNLRGLLYSPKMTAVVVLFFEVPMDSRMQETKLLHFYFLHSSKQKIISVLYFFASTSFFFITTRQLQFYTSSRSINIYFNRADGYFYLQKKHFFNQFELHLNFLKSALHFRSIFEPFKTLLWLDLGKLKVMRWSILKILNHHTSQGFWARLTQTFHCVWEPPLH